MTRFGHKLNYVINTFVKHTPDQYQRRLRDEINFLEAQGQLTP